MWEFRTALILNELVKSTWIWECLEISLLKRALHLGHFDPEGQYLQVEVPWAPTLHKDGHPVYTLTCR